MNKYALRNRTKASVLATDVYRAASAWDRMRRLLGHAPDDFQPGKGLWLTPCQWIHTFGMSFPIDAVYLNSDHEVIHTCRNLRPWRSDSDVVPSVCSLSRVASGLRSLGLCPKSNAWWRLARMGKNVYRSVSPATLSEHIRTTIKVSAENSNATDQSLLRLHERNPELGELERFAKTNPEDVAARLQLAEAYTAEKLYYPAFQLYPDSAEGAGLLGRIHLCRNDPALAKAAFLKALTSKPENPSLLTWLGQADLKLGN